MIRIIVMQLNNLNVLIKFFHESTLGSQEPRISQGNLSK